MELYYYNNFEDYVPVIFGMLLVWGVVIVLALLAGVAVWVFRSLSLYQLASRRGLASPWLSWLPVGRDWVVGSISDQYQYLVHGKIRSRRKFLVGFSIGSFSGSVITLIVLIWALVESAVTAAVYGEVGFGLTWALMSLPLLLVLTLAAWVATYVLRCVCKYDLYRSCDPGCAVVFLVIGILFSICDPIFMWVCRKKDLGMPPRKPENRSFAGGCDPTYL